MLSSRRFYGAALVAMLMSGLVSVTPASAETRAEWQKKVVKSVIKAHIYPRSAIRREIEGRAIVKISIDRSGTVQGFEIITPSGQKALDKVIPKIVKKLDPLPAPPEEMPGDIVNFNLPLTWRLE